MSFGNNGELRTCKTCGTLFLYSGIGKITCPKCNDKENTDFELVKDYILEYPLATIQEISTSTNVRINKIREFLREGRLVISDKSPIFLNCELCGAPIKFGRVCKNCADSLDPAKKTALKLNDYTIADKPNTSRNKSVHFLT